MDQQALIQEIVAIAEIPSPTFGEEARLDWIVKRLERSFGHQRQDAAGNVIWWWGDGRPGVLLTAHVDTVFPLSTSIVIERDGDRLVGPGVGDNAAAIAVAIRVVEDLLRAHDLRPAAVAFTVGEEGLGNLRGARHACAELSPLTVIALEGHGLESVLADAVGSVRARLSINGPGGHAWKDRAQPSAIHALVEIAATILNDSDNGSPINIGVIKGGLAVNAIAGEAELVLEKRSFDAAELSAFVTYLTGLSCDRHLSLTVEILGERPAGTLPRDSPLLTTVLAVRKRLGLEELIESGSTDANAAIGLGIPALGLGVSRGRDMHTTKESIDIDSLALGAKQLELVLTTMLSSKLPEVLLPGLPLSR